MEPEVGGRWVTQRRRPNPRQRCGMPTPKVRAWTPRTALHMAALRLGRAPGASSFPSLIFAEQTPDRKPAGGAWLVLLGRRDCRGFAGCRSGGAGRMGNRCYRTTLLEWTGAKRP